MILLYRYITHTIQYKNTYWHLTLINDLHMVCTIYTYMSEKFNLFWSLLIGFGNPTPSSNSEWNIWFQFLNFFSKDSRSVIFVLNGTWTNIINSHNNIHEGYTFQRWLCDHCSPNEVTIYSLLTELFICRSCIHEAKHLWEHWSHLL